MDGARTGRARTALGGSGLRTEWRAPLGTLVERGPLVDAKGMTYVLGTQGDVVAIGRDGVEHWRVSTGASAPGPAALLADDTVVFVDAAGEAVGVRRGATRWQVRIGRGAPTPAPAPLPLADGGVVVATASELAVLDADGGERARTALPEAVRGPLVAALGRVVAVAASGAVWSWKPGAAEPVRVAKFRSGIDGGAALSDDHTLIAVTATRTEIAEVDLLRGTTTTRAFAPAGLWLGPVAMRGTTAYLVLRTATGDLAVAVDRSGGETARTLIGLHPPAAPASSDGGAVAPLVAPHTAPLVDGMGVFAFATSEGAIGVVQGDAVDRLPEACDPPMGSVVTEIPPVVGLAPLEDGAFVAVCRSGAVLAIRRR